MKTVKNLYPQLSSFANLDAAWRKARKGKRGKQAVARFEFDLETNLLQLERELQDKTKHFSPPLIMLCCARFCFDISFVPIRVG